MMSEFIEPAQDGETGRSASDEAGQTAGNPAGKLAVTGWNSDLEERIRKAIQGWARSKRLGRSLAEDLEQDGVIAAYEVLLRAPASLPADVAELRTYLSRCAINAATDRLRKELRRISRQEALDRAESVADPANCLMEIVELDEAVSREPEEIREVLYLRVQGFTSKESAALVELPHDTVRSRIQRGLKSVRQMA